MTDAIDVKETSSVDKYDGTNFQMWKMHMQFIFQSKDFWSIVDGTVKKTDASDPIFGNAETNVLR